jgi:hypothetical protein
MSATIETVSSIDLLPIPLGLPDFVIPRASFLSEAIMEEPAPPPLETESNAGNPKSH